MPQIKCALQPSKRALTSTSMLRSIGASAMTIQSSSLYPKAVVLQLKQPVGVVEGRVQARKWHVREVGKRQSTLILAVSVGPARRVVARFQKTFTDIRS